MFFTTEFLLGCAFSFGAYYLGIFIRFRVFPGPNALPLQRQFLLGIPFSIAVVAPLLLVFNKAIGTSTENQIAMITTLGVIMEHGLVLNETFTKWLQEHISGNNE